MRAAKIMLSFGIALLMAGCSQSLYPLSSTDNLVFKPELVGTWAVENGKEQATFSQASELNTYHVTYTGRGSSAEFEARLVQLGDFLFLEVYPRIQNEIYRDYMVPAYMFFRLSIERDVVRVAALDLRKMINQRKLKIGHVGLKYRIVLTAPTEELQKFVLQNAENLEEFSKISEWHRQK